MDVLLEILDQNMAPIQLVHLILLLKPLVLYGKIAFWASVRHMINMKVAKLQFGY